MVMTQSWQEEVNALTAPIVGAAIEVHKTLGPGWLESVYEQCLVYELGLQGMSVARQKPLPIRYKDVALDGGYRLDLLVNDQGVVELKAVEKRLPIHLAQMITYLKLSQRRIGLLFNFNVLLLKNGGIKRVLL